MFLKGWKFEILQPLLHATVFDSSSPSELNFQYSSTMRLLSDLKFVINLFFLSRIALATEQSTRLSHIDKESHVTQGSFLTSNLFTSYIGLNTHADNRLGSNFTTLSPRSSLTNVKSSRPVQFLDTGSGKWFYWSVSYIVVPFISFLCVLSNIINIAVFFRVGLKDGASLVFLSLSVSDMAYSALSFTNLMLRSLELVMDQHPYLILRHLAFIIGYYRRMFFDISILITVFAGVQKCACVAIPLTFRQFFTFRKTLVTLIMLYACAVVYYLPQITNMYMAPGFDRRFNRSRLMIKTINFRLSMVLLKVSKAFNRIALPFVAEIILIFCVATMTYKLKQAAVSRHSMTSATDQEAKLARDEGIEKGNKLSAKELRVIRSVNIICSIFIAGTAPRCIIEGCDLAMTSFGDHLALYYLLNSVQEFVVQLSVAANIIVYFKFNTKYRDSFLGMFSCIESGISQRNH